MCEATWAAPSDSESSSDEKVEVVEDVAPKKGQAVSVIRCAFCGVVPDEARRGWRDCRFEPWTVSNHGPLKYKLNIFQTMTIEYFGENHCVLRPHHLIPPIAACPSSCDEETWFAHRRVTAGGKVKDEPTGRKCLPCGAAVEAWPLEVEADLLEKFHSKAAKFSKPFKQDLPQFTENRSTSQQYLFV